MNRYFFLKSRKPAKILRSKFDLKSHGASKGVPKDKQMRTTLKQEKDTCSLFLRGCGTSSAIGTSSATGAGTSSATGAGRRRIGAQEDELEWRPLSWMNFNLLLI